MAGARFVRVLRGAVRREGDPPGRWPRRRPSGAPARQRTILFVDEIHRFNRAQQDAFLPHVEKGTIVLVGATTENPSFEVNAALLSRCRVYVLRALAEDDLVTHPAPRARRRRARPGAGWRRGRATRRCALDRAAWPTATRARRSTCSSSPCSWRRRRAAAARDRGRRSARRRSSKTLLYDKAGEEHYNLISALHKSLRDSDPDAALYWLTRMLEAGEDPLYVARRLVRFASEDVGNADPRALALALAAKDAYDFLGSPEGELALAQATLLPGAGAEVERRVRRVQRGEGTTCRSGRPSRCRCTSATRRPGS